MAVHHYRTELTWEGSTGAGYDHYDREHGVRCDPVVEPLIVSADPAFGGDPRRLNPEQLLLVAAASCQLLSFLAVAARARIDVVAYRDAGEAEMPDEPRPTAIRRIVLRPEITVVEGPSEDRIRHLVEVAHRECFIANSLRVEPEVRPMVRFVPPA